jgi:hypothetical protein
VLTIKLVNFNITNTILIYNQSQPGFDMPQNQWGSAGCPPLPSKWHSLGGQTICRLCVFTIVRLASSTDHPQLVGLTGRWQVRSRDIFTARPSLATDCGERWIETLQTCFLVHTRRCIAIPCWSRSTDFVDWSEVRSTVRRQRCL